MKINGLFSRIGALTALTVCLLLALLLPAAAQTFNGRLMLTSSPNQLEAAVYPVSNRAATISVIFNNQSREEVRIVIRNARGRVFYNERDYSVLYRRYFNLSELPTDNYTVELNQKRTNYVRTFAINSPAQRGWITMDAPLRPDTPDFPDSTGKQLTIK